jgi:polysaccharide export outer membrane protein
MANKRLLICLLSLICLTWIYQTPAQETKGTVPQAPAGAAVPADSDSYIIGPEDVLDIYVWKETDLSRKVPVRLDGKISIPLVGEIQAAGLTPLKLKERLIQKFKEYVEVPNVTVTVMEANSFKVFVTGQVAKPGVFILRSETTIAQIIPMAGGFTEWANQRKILVLRHENGKETRITVNYKKIMNGEDFSQNIKLKPGDTILVPD